MRVRKKWEEVKKEDPVVAATLLKLRMTEKLLLENPTNKTLILREAKILINDLDDPLQASMYCCRVCTHSR